MKTWRDTTWRVAVGLMVLMGTAFGQTPSGSGPPTLAGTSWQLVRFQGGDGRVVTPDDGSKYTLAFAADGSVTTQIDCNRGRGTWKSSGPGQLALGPLALTRAACPPQSMHDLIVKHWENIRSYVIRNGNLFLSLMADGGIYEYRPARGGAVLQIFRRLQGAHDVHLRQRKRASRDLLPDTTGGGPVGTRRGYPAGVPGQGPVRIAIRGRRRAVPGRSGTGHAELDGRRVDLQTDVSGQASGDEPMPALASRRIGPSHVPDVHHGVAPPRTPAL